MNSKGCVMLLGNSLGDQTEMKTYRVGERLTMIGKSEFNNSRESYKLQGR